MFKIGGPNGSIGYWFVLFLTAVFTVIAIIIVFLKPKLRVHLRPSSPPPPPLTQTETEPVKPPQKMPKTAHILVRKSRVVKIKKHHMISQTGKKRENSKNERHHFPARNENLLTRPLLTQGIELSRGQLDVVTDMLLGEDGHGLVFYGHITNFPGKENENSAVPVVVKTVKPDADISYLTALLFELKVMDFLGCHDNIARLLGAVTTDIKRGELFIALEFCLKGDLLDYIQRNRSIFNDLLDSNTSITQNTPSFRDSKQLRNCSVRQRRFNSYSTLDLFEWARQISNGMDYLASMNAIHGVLAAKNVFITADNTVKISNFGISPLVVNYSVYKETAQTTPRLQWQWMSIELFRDKTFSIESDIWAFGVTLFELFSLGAIPYYNNFGSQWSREFFNSLEAGHRLNSPPFGNDGIHKLMMDCMRAEPTERWTFSQITKELKYLKRRLEYLDE